MKYALLDQNHHINGLVNFGDHVQSIAARQFLPQVDVMVERDELNRSDYPVSKIILNSWFTYKPENWPPNPNLKPLFVSFHLNPNYAQILLSKKENVEYFKKHEPIGCRDYRTEKILKEYGINAYYSFCLTSTLGLTYKHDGGSSGEVIFADVMYHYLPVLNSNSLGWDKNGIISKLSYLNRIFIKKKKRSNVLNKLFPQHILKSRIEISHMVDANQSSEELFKIAEDMLIRFSKAKLVVTSRIHCALPCLAMGTPVLFVMDGLKAAKGDLSRLKGTVNFLNVLSDKPVNEIKTLLGENVNILNPKDINWEKPPLNPQNHIAFSNSLIERCKIFINDKTQDI